MGLVERVNLFSKALAFCLTLPFGDPGLLVGGRGELLGLVCGLPGLGEFLELALTLVTLGEFLGVALALACTASSSSGVASGSSCR